jgi:hypothetical protein
MSKRSPGTHHVVPSHNGGWDVRRGGAERASGHFDTKTEAVDRGREMSRNVSTEFRIHNRERLNLAERQPRSRPRNVAEEANGWPR